MNEVPSAEGWLYEIKFDGYRMEGILRHGVGQFISRNNLEWSNKFPHLMNALEKLPVHDAIFDGEVVALDNEGRSHFQDLQNFIKKKDDQGLCYFIFDVLYLNGEDLRDLPLIERKKRLKSLIPAHGPIIYSEHITGDGESFFKLTCKHQLEGIISKLADSPYHSGRNDLWVKTKCKERQELIIVGWTDPQGGRSGIGALVLGVYDKGKLRYAGRVGTGFDHKTLLSIYQGLRKIEREHSPLEVNSPEGKDIHWVEPEKVCEVTFGNWTKDGILRTAVFKGMREDRERISSPDKILFKKEKITKQDISEFYQKIAKIMLPYMRNRPLSLVRCPDGPEGSCFFQKHVSGKIPSAFHTFSIKEDEGKGVYFSIDSAQGLQELVQLNAFELHAWNCQWDNYLRPDQIIIDFDPGPGVNWKEVVSAAFELKEMLEALSLKSFVKVTGGKGLHVHIPIAPLYSWEQIKSFAQTLALELVARYPKKFTANMSKRVRKNKIFVDYLRNGYGATAVVPYSLRARPVSAVALPLAWGDLRRTRSADQFTLAKALKKILARKKDPWAGMLKLKQKISILVPE